MFRLRIIFTMSALIVHDRQTSTVSSTSKKTRDDIYRLYSLVAVVIQCSQYHTLSLLFL